MLYSTNVQNLYSRCLIPGTAKKNKIRHCDTSFGTKNVVLNHDFRQNDLKPIVQLRRPRVHYPYVRRPVFDWSRHPVELVYIRNTFTN
jgi:hypothetical protein